MSARQRIRGLRVVIELPAIPTVGVVAGTTRLSECAFVIVAIRVAIAAHLRHSGEIELRMTRLTRGGRVNADQRELRECVIERDRVPRDFGMATFARAIAAAVRIVLLVTADARLRQRVGQCTAMAAFAAQRFVRALQRKTGLLGDDRTRSSMSFRHGSRHSCRRNGRDDDRRRCGNRCIPSAAS